MKVTVIEIFQDKFGAHHNIGDVIEVGSDRIANLEAKNLIKVDSVAEKKPTTKRKVKEA